MFLEHSLRPLPPGIDEPPLLCLSPLRILCSVDLRVEGELIVVGYYSAATDLGDDGQEKDQRIQLEATVEGASEEARAD